MLSLAFTTTVVVPTGCSTAKVSETSVYQGDSFLFQAERFQVQAHDLFVEFYRWEQQYRQQLPVEVSRAADFMRLNEKKWMETLNAAHDVYVGAPNGANRDKLQLTLNLLKTALSQAALYMASNSADAPNMGLDRANNQTLKSLGVTRP